MINEIYIDNYKSFREFRLSLNSDLNIIVGDNEAGKSTILEAINLALTFRLQGRQIPSEMSAFLFNNDCRDDYLAKLKDGSMPPLPKITIELYFVDDPKFAMLKGTNNTKKTNQAGICLEILFDEDYRAEYETLIADVDKVNNIPVEYYHVTWHSFANNAVTLRSLPISCSHIDATTIRLQTGADYYMQSAISDSLSAKERVSLAVAYRQLKEQFASEPSINTINTSLAALYTSILNNRSLKISVDISQRANWETGVIPYLEELPFQFIGRGEQTIIKTMVALARKAEKSQVVLIEEPETHLSYSSMSKLIAQISKAMEGKQIILSTHSPYVLNKLGLSKLILLSTGTAVTMATLPQDTQDYFMKLPGYDTLRLILSDNAILVEGPSDELLIQRAFMDLHGGKLPIEERIDVISVRGLSFKRFLDIATELKRPVRVVTDNDGDYASNITKKYEKYKDFAFIQICADTDNACNNIERQLLKANGLETLNRVLGQACPDEPALIKYMEANKTEYALKIFESTENIKYPEYLANVVK